MVPPMLPERLQACDQSAHLPHQPTVRGPVLNPVQNPDTGPHQGMPPRLRPRTALSATRSHFPQPHPHTMLSPAINGSQPTDPRSRPLHRPLTDRWRAQAFGPGFQWIITPRACVWVSSRADIRMRPGNDKLPPWPRAPYSPTCGPAWIRSHARASMA
jgi:hypothetical protein